MKPTLLLPPVVALAIAGYWIGSQRLSISVLERESTALQKAIAVRAPGGLADSSAAKPTFSSKSKKDKEPLDWKKIAAQIAQLQSSDELDHLRSQVNFQQRLQAMSKEELVAALDEIAALDLPEESRATLEQMLIGPLALKDPEFVLTKFIHQIQDNHGMISWQLANAMQEWTKKDPSRAIAWFDQQIADGKFDSKSLDGKSQPRLQFEGNLINVLLGSDPDAAGRRLAALPEDQRDEALGQHSSQPLKEEHQAAFAKLVRDQIPKEHQTRTLAQKASSLVIHDGDYSKVTGFLDRIQATPTERTACAEQAAESQLQNISHQKKISREDLDTMREWVATQAPESAGILTGKALANATQGFSNTEFSEAADLAAEYNKAGDNDDVISFFLEGSDVEKNQDKARALAGKISDPKRREEILKRLK